MQGNEKIGRCDFLNEGSECCSDEVSGVGCAEERDDAGDLRFDLGL